MALGKTVNDKLIYAKVRMFFWGKPGEVANHTLTVRLETKLGETVVDCQDMTFSMPSTAAPFLPENLDLSGANHVSAAYDWLKANAPLFADFVDC